MSEGKRSVDLRMAFESFQGEDAGAEPTMRRSNGPIKSSTGHAAQNRRREEAAHLRVRGEESYCAIVNSDRDAERPLQQISSEANKGGVPDRNEHRLHG